VYVLYKSTPEMWTAKRARVSGDGSWVASIGRWNDVTTEESPNRAELSVLLTQIPLEEQHIGISGEGVILIPADRLREISGTQSKPLRVAVEPMVQAEFLRVDTPTTGSVVEATASFEVSGFVSGTLACVYVLHRTPDMAKWAAHRA